MSLDRRLNDETYARKKIQSLIKGWLTDIEDKEVWFKLSDTDQKDIRRALIRVGWGAYKIGLLTLFEPSDEAVHAESD